MNPVDAGLPAGVTESVEVPRRADAVRNREKVIAAAEQVFAEHGIEIPLPQRQVRLESAAPLAVSVMPGEA